MGQQGGVVGNIHTKAYTYTPTHYICVFLSLKILRQKLSSSYRISWKNWNKSTSVRSKGRSASWGSPAVAEVQARLSTRDFPEFLWDSLSISTEDGQCTRQPRCHWDSCVLRCGMWPDLEVHSGDVYIWTGPVDCLGSQWRGAGTYRARMMPF